MSATRNPSRAQEAPSPVDGPLLSKGGLFPFCIFALVALAYAGPGLLPGSVLLPLDLLSDVGAWKRDPNLRVPVSNRLLSDAVLQFRPWDAAARRAIGEGRIPWRNPWASDGAPLFANPQAALLSPFTWPRLLFGEWGWGLCVFLKLLLAGAGMGRLARELGASPGASIISGIVYMTSGFSVVWGLYPATGVFAFLPWLARAARRLLRQASARNALAVTLFAALATAGGHPETLAFGVVGVLAFLWWDTRALGKEGVPKVSPKNAAVTTGAALAGFLLLAVHLVPFALILARSRILEARSKAPPAGFRAFAVAGQILPGFLGSPLGGEIDLSGAVPGSENFHNRSEGFVGLVVLVLILLAARRIARPLRRGLVTGCVALVVSWNPPLLEGLWRAVPVLSWLAAPYAVVVFVLFASAAAGPALVAVSERPERNGRAAAALLLGGLLLLAAGFLPSLRAAEPALRRVARSGVDRLRERRYLKRDPDLYAARMSAYLAGGRAAARRRLAVPGLFWVAAAVGLLVRKKRGAILGCAAVGELLAFGAGYMPAVRRERIPPPPPAIEELRRLVPDSSWMIAAGPDVYPPNLATLDRFRDIRSYDLLESADWITRLNRCRYHEPSRSFPEGLAPHNVACLAAEGVRFFLSRSPIVGAKLVAGGPPPAVGAYELPGSRLPPLPKDSPPDGLRAGAAGSLLSLMLLVVLARSAARRSLEP